MPLKASVRVPAMLPARLALLLSLASAGTAQTVEDQIRAEVTRYVEAINGGDPRPVAALYLDDPGISSLGDGQIYRGWQTIADLLREVYEQAGTIRMTADSVSVLPLGRDAAVAVLRYRWVIGRTDPQTATGAMTLVYTRTPRGWRVAHDHTSTLAPDTASALATAPPTDAGPKQPTRETRPCTIARIVDGDTVDCQRAGRVRLIGIDTPELNQRPFGAQAASALAAIAPVGSTVQLEQDVEARDRYGRLLGYLWRDTVMVNWLMVREGWAVVLTYPPNVQYVAGLTEAQRRAREEGRGLWATGGFNCLPADRRRGRCE